MKLLLRVSFVAFWYATQGKAAALNRRAFASALDYDGAVREVTAYAVDRADVHGSANGTVGGSPTELAQTEVDSAGVLADAQHGRGQASERRQEKPGTSKNAVVLFVDGHMTETATMEGPNGGNPKPRQILVRPAWVVTRRCKVGGTNCEVCNSEVDCLHFSAVMSAATKSWDAGHNALNLGKQSSKVFLSRNSPWRVFTRTVHVRCKSKVLHISIKPFAVQFGVMRFFWDGQLLSKNNGYGVRTKGVFAGRQNANIDRRGKITKIFNQNTAEDSISVTVPLSHDGGHEFLMEFTADAEPPADKHSEGWAALKQQQQDKNYDEWWLANRNQAWPRKKNQNEKMFRPRLNLGGTMMYMEKKFAECEDMKACLHVFPEDVNLRSDPALMQQCLHATHPADHGDLCVAWRSCLATGAAAAEGFRTRILLLIAAANGGAALLQSNVSAQAVLKASVASVGRGGTEEATGKLGGNGQTRCINPPDEDPASWSCDCFGEMERQCAAIAGKVQGYDKTACMTAHMCSRAGVCKPWMDLQCAANNAVVQAHMTALKARLTMLTDSSGALLDRRGSAHGQRVAATLDETSGQKVCM